MNGGRIVSIKLDTNGTVRHYHEGMNGLCSKLWYVFKIPLCVFAAVMVLAFLNLALEQEWHDYEMFRWRNYPLFNLLHDAALIGLCWLLMKRGGSFRDIFSLHPVSPKILGCALASGCCFVLLWNYAVAYLALGRPLDDFGLFLLPGVGGFWFYVSMAIASVMGVIYVEVVYRAIILKRMLGVFRPATSLTVNALVPYLEYCLSGLILVVFYLITFEGGNGPDKVPVYQWWYWLGAGRGYEILRACLLGFVFLWTRSIGATIAAGLGIVLTVYGRESVIRFLASCGAIGTVMAFVVLGGGLAACLVYMYRRRVTPSGLDGEPVDDARDDSPAT